MLQRSLMSVMLLIAGVAGCQSPYPTTPVDRPPPPAGSPVGLWSGGGSPPAILRLASAQLRDSGERTPETVLTTPSAQLADLIGVAFDRVGNLWVVSAGDSLVLEFAAADLARPGPAVAKTIIRPIDQSLAGPAALAFDREGRLWVANHQTGTLVRFDSAQLVAGGAQVPAVTISGARHPTGLAFDAAGSLWVSDNVAWRVFGYTNSQLAASGSPLPPVILSRFATAGLVEPAGLAFDGEGNLWVANFGRQTVVSYSPAQRAVSGSPAPDIVLTTDGSSLTLPTGLAFDAEGSLWVVGGAGTLTKFRAESLRSSGAPPPSARLSVAGGSLLWSAAFWPKPAGLPLN